MLKEGNKLYHYVYGPMTVVKVDENYIDVVVDMPEGIVTNDVFKSLRLHTFPVDALDHWIFTNPSRVKQIDNLFSINTTQEPKPLIYNPNLLHSFYTSGDKIKRYSDTVDEKNQESSPITVDEGILKSNMKSSSVTALGEKDRFSKSSSITAVENSRESSSITVDDTPKTSTKSSAVTAKDDNDKPKKSSSITIE